MGLLFALGFSSGLPLLLVFSTLGIWLTEVGVDKTTIGAFALASTPYSFKFLWAPIVDQLRIPVLDRLFGRRRSWMLMSQVALVAAIGALAFSAPAGASWAFAGFDVSVTHNVMRTAALAITVAALSATQDIVLDAYRVEVLGRSEQGAGAAVFVFGYRVGMLVAGAGALLLATAAETGHGIMGVVSAIRFFGLPETPWSVAYTTMALLMLPGIAATLAAPRAASDGVMDAPTARDTTFGQAVAAVFRRAVVEPLAAFVRARPAGLWALVLGFVFLFKLSDALAAVLVNPFLVDIGFDRAQIAAIAKTYGMVASITGALMGGALVKLLGLRRALWISLGLMVASNLMFALQARAGADPGFLVLTITVENLTGGFGTAAFVAYLSLLCDVRFTATQYALLTSISSVGRTMVGASTGVVAEQWGWEVFFTFTAVAGVPAIIVLWVLARMGSLGLDDEAAAASEGAGR